MKDFSAQTALAGVALLLMGAIAGALIFHAVPQDNQQLITFALGAISGALTVGGATKVADKMTTAGQGATINEAAPSDAPHS
jgi:hypothetical protein